MSAIHVHGGRWLIEVDGIYLQGRSPGELKLAVHGIRSVVMVSDRLIFQCKQKKTPLLRFVTLPQALRPYAHRQETRGCTNARTAPLGGGGATAGV